MRRRPDGSAAAAETPATVVPPQAPGQPAAVQLQQPLTAPGLYFVRLLYDEQRDEVGAVVLWS